MRRFERGDDAFIAAQVAERLQRFVVGDRHVLRPMLVLQPGVFGPDTGIIQTRRHGMGFRDLAIGVLQQVGTVPVQDAGLSCAQGRRVFAARQALARGLYADQAHLRVADVGVENAHRVRAAAHAGNHRIGLAPGHLGHLQLAFLADDRLEIAHHHRIRMRAGDRAEDIEGVLDVRHPIAHRLVQRVLERFRARFDGHDIGAQQLHAIDVLRLALDVLRAHVHDAFHAETRGDRGRGDAVHAGPGFRDHALLAHVAREQRLADGVVDLVRAGVVQVLALEIDLRAAEHLRPAPRVVDRARAADVMLQLMVEFGHERRVAATALVGIAQFIERVAQGLGDEDAAIRAKVPARVGQVIHLHSGPR